MLVLACVFDPSQGVGSSWVVRFPGPVMCLSIDRLRLPGEDEKPPQVGFVCLDEEDRQTERVARMLKEGNRSHPISRHSRSLPRSCTWLPDSPKSRCDGRSGTFVGVPEFPSYRGKLPVQSLKSKPVGEALCGLFSAWGVLAGGWKSCSSARNVQRIRKRARNASYWDVRPKPLSCSRWIPMRFTPVNRHHAHPARWLTPLL